MKRSDRRAANRWRRSRSRPPRSAASSHHPSASQKVENDIVNIGKSVVIKGELNGSEDLTIEGQVEGTIQLREHVLTIGPNGRIKAQVFAKSVIVLGQVSGNVTASEKVDIRDNGSVDGDIVSPRVAIAEGAHFRGSVDMQRKGAPAQPQKQAAASPPPHRPRQATRPPPSRPRPAAAAAPLPSASAPDGVRPLASAMGLLDRIVSRKVESESPAVATTAGDEPVFSTKALRKFLTCLTSRESPVLLDLGAVVGSNVSFFGEQLGCKIFVENIYADLERHVRNNTLDAFPEFLKTRFTERVLGGRRHPVLGHHRLSRSPVGARADRAAGARAAAGGRAARLLRHGAAARYVLHEVHRRGRCEPEAPPVSRPRAAASRFCRTATSSGCSRRCACRTRFSCRTTCARFSFESPPGAASRLGASRRPGGCAGRRHRAASPRVIASAAA